MFKTRAKIIEENNKKAKELIDKYVNTHVVSVDFEANGKICIWIGSERKSFEERCRDKQM